MTIREITVFNPEVQEIIDSFLRLLVSSEIDLSTSLLKELISSDNNHLFFAYDESENCCTLRLVRRSRAFAEKGHHAHQSVLAHCLQDTRRSEEAAEGGA